MTRLDALRPEMSAGEATALLRAVFAEAGLPEAALDARVLATAALGIDPASLLARPERLLGTAAQHMRDHAQRRLGREPVARILGVKEFWGLPLLLSPDTLVPRPDTESLVETALALRPERAGRRRVLDLGTGTGALLLALLSEWLDATGLGVDAAEGAVRTARGNAGRTGMAGRACFAVADWGAAVGGPFDVVVSNPPYIRSSDLPTLEPEVSRHDPRRALDGGPDGLSAYGAILADLPRYLSPDGLALFEVGHDTAAPVRDLVGAHGFRVVQVGHDLGGRPRTLAFVAGRALAPWKTRPT